MVEAVEAAPPWRLDIVGPVRPADAAWLDATAADCGRVRLHGRLLCSGPGSWHGAPGRGGLLHDTAAFRAAVPTKLYEYLG